MEQMQLRASSNHFCSLQLSGCPHGLPARLSSCLLCHFWQSSARTTRLMAQCVLAGALVLTGYMGQNFWHQTRLLNISPAALVSSASCSIREISADLHSF
jgi:hypothetical protein